MWQQLIGDEKSNQVWTHAKDWKNVVVPRGPGMGSHMAPNQGRMTSVKNVWGSIGFEPKTTHQTKSLKESTNTNAPHMSLIK